MSCKQVQFYTPQYSTKHEKGTHCYILGVHPLHNPERLFEVYEPLAKYLSDSLTGIKIKIEASRNYAAYEEKISKRKFHLAIPNPYQTLISLNHGYRVIGKMADDTNFRGIILVRKDSNIQTVQQLKGKSISYPAPTALAATLLPQHYLQKHGLNINTDIEEIFVGSQESSIMNVYMGHVTAACTWIPPWKAYKKQNPELAAELEVKWTTQWLPNNGVIIRNDIDSEIADKIQLLITGLSKNERGKQILERMELSAYETATNNTYIPVKDFLIDYKSKVRDIDI